MHTPTLFFQQIQQFFDSIFIAIRDPKVTSPSPSIQTLQLLVTIIACLLLVNEMVSNELSISNRTLFLTFFFKTKAAKTKAAKAGPIRIHFFTLLLVPFPSFSLLLSLQPLIRERAVSALRACLRLTAQRESKEDVNLLNYQVPEASRLET